MCRVEVVMAPALTAPQKTEEEETCDVIFRGLARQRRTALNSRPVTRRGGWEATTSGMTSAWWAGENINESSTVAAASPPPSARKRKGAAGEAGKKEGAGVSKKMRSFLQEQEATVVAVITACQEAQSQLDQYQAWGERQQQQLEDSLQGLVDQSRSARELIQQEMLRVAAKKEEAKKREQELLAVQMLLTPATEQEACMAVAEVFHCTSEAEQVVEEYQQCFPDASILTTTKKVREAFKAALEAAQAVQAAPDTVTTEEPRAQFPVSPRRAKAPVCPRPHHHGKTEGQGPPPPDKARKEPAAGWPSVSCAPGGRSAPTCKNKSRSWPAVPPRPEGAIPAAGCGNPAGELCPVFP
ncbi:uncharacterized protein LOC127004071 isoform X2 [Eriocheir sinensis]|uniref:uncharacterized protein LOC127004071 isoform X2 n=1 Tax=Eriocheir sinensis TaxID=95602 RepID=UPI0021CA3942|nr:uncharacterized protein LOC127004071 isoform X2 [Eriocheir sinensis]